ncbi:MAG: sterol desaturase family protein [Candidatus Binatia bacterium]
MIGKLAAIAGTILYSNIVEWAWHRWPMHSKWGGNVYRRHKHHHPATWTPGMKDDFRLALTPPVLAIFSVHAIAAALIGRRKRRWPVATVVGTMAAYLALMDYIHKWQHAGAKTKNLLLRAVRRYHMAHHAYDRTRKDGFERSAKFNIWLPLADAIFGTLRV